MVKFCYFLKEMSVTLSYDVLYWNNLAEPSLILCFDVHTVCLGLTLMESS